jgi:hypothetical protein
MGCNEGEEENSSEVEQSFYINPTWRCIPLLYFPFLAGFVGSISTCFVRVMGGFVTTHPPPGRTTNFYGIMPVVYIAVLVIAAIASFIIINKGLKYFDSVYIAPLFKISGMLFNLFTGGIVLNEFGDYGSTKQFVCFIGGI